MLDDRFYPQQAGGVERHLPVRPGSSLYARRPEDGPQREPPHEVENTWDLQGWVGRTDDAGGAAITATEAELSATFMPPFYRASGLPQQQQQQQHHPRHRRPSPDFFARGAGTDRDLSARSTAASGGAGNFAHVQHSRVGWEQSSGASSDSADTRTMVHRAVPQGVDLGVSLGRRQKLEIVQDRRQQSGGSDCSSGDLSISRRYNSFAQENFSDHSTSRMRRGDVPRDLAAHRYERASGPASVFQTQQVFERRATQQPRRGIRGRDDVIDEGFSGCNNHRDAFYHGRNGRSGSQPRAMTSLGSCQHSEGSAPMGALYQLEPTSPPPPSSPLIGRQQCSSSSTPQLQNVLDSSSVRSLSSTYGSRRGGGYDDVLEQQQRQQRRFSLAARSSIPITPSWAAQRQHGGADGINGSDRDHSGYEEVRQGRGVYPSNIATGSARSSSSSSSSLSYSSDRLDAGPGRHYYRQHHQYQHPERQQHQQHQQQEDETSSGDAFDVLRRAPAPHYARIHHDDPRQINCYSAVSYRSEGEIDRRLSARRLDPTIASLSASDGLHHRHHGGGRLPRERTEAERGCTMGGDEGGNPAVVSVAVQSPEVAPSFAAPSPAPDGPFEWLKNINLRQSSYGGGSQGVDEGTDTPSTARSSSSASTASSLAITTVDGCGGGDGSKISPRSGFSGHQRAALAPVGGRGEMVTTTADGVCRTCPAPDCPGNGDCLPGASPDMLVYEVQFKRAIRTFLPGENIDPASISCGVLMKVEADRGEDLGIIHRSLPLSEYLHAQNEERKAKAAKIAENGGGGGGNGDGSESKKKRSKAKKAEEDGGGKNGAKRRGQQNQTKPEEPQEKPCPVRAIKRILRPATAEELQELQDKSQQEVDVLRVCQHKVRQRSLPMKIVDAEYQFDMHKLTLFFEAERRIDFRELVRDLFAVYKTRIWMQQVKDKHETTRSGARAAAAAAIAAATSNDSDETAPPTASPDDSDGSSGAHQEWEKRPASNLSFAAGGSFFALAFPHNVGHDARYESESSGSGNSSSSSSSGSGGD